MCAQCAATGAVAATAAATGGRVWLAVKAPAWFTGRTKTWISASVVIGGVLAAGLLA